MKITLSAGLILAAGTLFAQTQDKLTQDKKAILDMCGCYKVEFRYAEVYSPDTSYKFHDREYTWAYELVAPVEQNDKKIALQHVLVVNDSMVVKHWRQDWLFENTRAHLYNKDYNWIVKDWKKNDVKGQWTQKVYQVDDSPRYAGTASWVHVDGHHFWESVADSPLPRRELTAKRSDYNVLVRGNRHEITPYGWMHRQDNVKTLRDGGIDKVIAVETGWNTYTKVEEGKCRLAKEKWEATSGFWKIVREEWERVENAEEQITLKNMVDGQLLYARMFDLAEKAGERSEGALRSEVAGIIQQHLVKGDKAQL